MRTLLIDADIIAYQSALALEEAVEWEPGYWTWSCNEHAVRALIDRTVDDFKDTFKGDDAILCLTDPARNWRLDVLPTYKGKRSNVKKPLVLKAIRQWLIDERGAYLKPRLEGDDVMGILATLHTKRYGERVIVSIDKDMKTIPGLYVRDRKSKIVEVSGEEADNWHLIQALAGDVTDGYDGCPGIGLKRAKRIVEEKVALEEYEHVLERGKRKGQTEKRTREVEAETAWDAVLSHYYAAGLCMKDALRQARVARILRATDYNFNKKEPILWAPTTGNPARSSRAGRSR